uniref:ATP-dependent DNA helicase RecG n=1 Tax=Candidatus Kentrum sp. TC TaxID=2126339 RepID=A0A450YUB0_9GAMM|nr:MAG: ATP-dependent DNA helicase RecG [Candidatus Kentron sp. TC]
MEEALVNAVYHRSYDGEPEPIKVYLYPNRMMIASYPGPVPGVEHRHLAPAASLPMVPLRNRRVGEFLKELGLAEGRGTGIPKVFRSMKQNGSPAPVFDFDEERTYFQVTLPAHPEYVAINALRDAAHLRAIGDEMEALRRLLKAHGEFPGSETLVIELIRESARLVDIEKAREVFDGFMEDSAHARSELVITTMAGVFLDARREKDAGRTLDRLPTFLMSANAAFDAAIAERRLDRQKNAHRYFEQAGNGVYGDVRALHKFAQTKMKLAKDLYFSYARKNSQAPFQWNANKRLLREAREMLERVLQMDAQITRHAWAWHDMGRILTWIRAPRTDIERAFQKASELLPDEPRFREALARTQRK